MNQEELLKEQFDLAQRYEEDHVLAGAGASLTD